MNKIILKDLDSTNIPNFELTNLKPGIYSVDAYIGPEGGDQADVFTFRLKIDPDFERKNEPEFVDQTLTLKVFDWNQVKISVTKLLDKVSGETWEEVGNELQHYMQWEFYGYKGGF